MSRGTLMPLPFTSMSHGTIPFGFFNINTDMLLLDRYAFFSTEFCNLIEKILTSDSDRCNWEVFRFNGRNSIGDLHEAIAGKVHEGFIGSVYNLFPFPKDLELFKQSTYGYKTQKVILPLIKRYAQRNEIVVRLGPEIFSLGAYKFNIQVFNKLLNYVISGGYPRWENETIPDYVKKIIVATNF